MNDKHPVTCDRCRRDIKPGKKVTTVTIKDGDGDVIHETELCKGCTTFLMHYARTGWRDV